MGYLLLEGGAEFGGRMRDPDLKAIELAGGFEAPIRIIPTAAAPDNNYQRAGNRAPAGFKAWGRRMLFHCLSSIKPAPTMRVSQNHCKRRNLSTCSVALQVIS